MPFRFSLVALAFASLLASGAALADSAPVSVKVNMARILRINAPASTVIIGNPGIADVTIQDPQTLVLTGKSYGQTNLIVLDNEGNPIADTMIEVVQEQAGLVTVYLGDKRTSLACEPVCQPIIMLGDDTGYTGTTIGSSQAVSSAAAAQ
ncbi:MAG: pilus assembly protein CpaC [Devosia sp.]|uniref:pilus assembly protein N-terminal domain-containing protein n=1 Tax=Devosia sp. TaxID=1871048 RepID=UPI00262449B3|nr:pilus assembly protein N-terminal domain-containing protein [Devosia sp.]MDB5541889.1 pilus assembly protein CpaC [Devosia sp.]